MPEQDVPTSPHSEAPDEPLTLRDEGFVLLVKTLFVEHEERELAAIHKMTLMVDQLIHDARGLHLQSAAHGSSIARLESDITELKDRLNALEKQLETLKELRPAF